MASHITNQLAEQHVDVKVTVSCRHGVKPPLTHSLTVKFLPGGTISTIKLSSGNVMPRFSEVPNMVEVVA